MPIPTTQINYLFSKDKLMHFTIKKKKKRYGEWVVESTDEGPKLIIRKRKK